MPVRGSKLITLNDRLAKLASNLRRQAEKMPSGPYRDSLIRKARDAEAATRRDDWVETLKP